MAQEWQSPHFQNHKLVGKIWSVKEGKFVAVSVLDKAVKQARFVLLGEIHTNKDHHLLQARFLSLTGRDGTLPPYLVVEMIPQSLGDQLASMPAQERGDLELLGTFLKWKKRGWGPWENYLPIFKTAQVMKAPILPGNLDREEIRTIGRGGESTIAPTRRSQLHLDLKYSKTQKSALGDMLFESHCKMVPKQALGPMALVQQARDGYMANQMLSIPDGLTGVLIAGSGHVRNDWAVPRILKARKPKAHIVTISFTEVTPDQLKPQDYDALSKDGSAVFDYLYFTPKSEIKDHCAELAKRFKKHKPKKTPK